MSLSEIRNVVLLFSNPVWAGASTVPTTIIRNITALSSQVAYEQRINNNITTLTTTNADTLDGLIQGLLYVPDISGNAACDKLQYDFIPPNVTRRNDLPPTNYKLIALAPWFNMDCTHAYLSAARLDQVRGFVFYKSNNSTNKPQDVDSPVWSLDDNGQWKTLNQFPVFAVPGLQGQEMMKQLSLYSGNVSEIPHGEEITELYGPNPQDYVRVWTELEMENPSNMLALWTFFLIAIGSLLVIIAAVSLTMHLIQRRRRKSLKVRVETGEVDLEASGIKRLTVPANHLKNFPYFTYNAEPDMLSSSGPPTPSTVGAPVSSHSVRSSRSRNSRRRAGDAHSIVSDIRPPGSIRSKRSSLAGSVDTTATNFQPNCQICLLKFTHRQSIIRELPCGHIFHPQCIDEYLTQNSSLCPQCKHCMLPRGYSPKITNAMVRRERALRRLRGRVDLEDHMVDTGETKIRSWAEKLFGRSKKTDQIPMAPVKREDTPLEANGVSGRGDSATTLPLEASTIPEESAGGGADDGHPMQPAPAARSSKPRRKKPRKLSTLPTQPEDAEMGPVDTGRQSPSSFARQRMRAIAAKNAPFDDPDAQRPKWLRALGHVFPAFS